MVLKGTLSGSGIDRNRKIRDLTATREAGFVKIWERDAISGRKKVFGMEMTELSSGCGIIVKEERECRIRPPRPDPVYTV